MVWQLSCSRLQKISCGLSPVHQANKPHYTPPHTLPINSIYTSRYLWRAADTIKDLLHPRQTLFSSFPLGKIFQNLKACTSRIKTASSDTYQVLEWYFHKLSMYSQSPSLCYWGLCTFLNQHFLCNCNNIFCTVSLFGLPTVLAHDLIVLPHGMIYRDSMQKCFSMSYFTVSKNGTIDSQDNIIFSLF